MHVICGQHWRVAVIALADMCSITEAPPEAKKYGAAHVKDPITWKVAWKLLGTCCALRALSTPGLAALMQDRMSSGASSRHE
jgi:hypothetical protein